MTRVSGITHVAYGRTGVVVSTCVGVRLSMQPLSLALCLAVSLHLQMSLNQCQQESVSTGTGSVYGQVRQLRQHPANDSLTEVLHARHYKVIFPITQSVLHGYINVELTGFVTLNLNTECPSPNLLILVPTLITLLHLRQCQECVNMTWNLDGASFMASVSFQ